MHDLGFLVYGLRVKLVPDARRGAADAVIHVEHVINQSRNPVRKLTVNGNRKNTVDEILAYAGLKPGMPVGIQELARLRSKLWESGRFRTCDVGCDLFYENGDWSIKIDVTEDEKAPRLSEPLSASEQSMLALRQWLYHPERWRCDLVYCGADEEGPFEVMISPKWSVLLWLGKRPAAGKPPAMRLAATIRPDSVGVFDAGGRTKFVTRPSAAESTLSLKATCSGTPPTPFELQLGIGIGGRAADDETTRPFWLELLFEPAACVGLVHAEDAHCMVQDGVLSHSIKDSRLRVDLSTGRLLEWTIISEQLGQLRVVSQAGAFDRRLREIEETTKDYRNALGATSAEKSLEKFLDQPGIVNATRFKQDDRFLPSVIWGFVKHVLHRSCGG
jgi:hypothetical protein